MGGRADGVAVYLGGGRAGEGNEEIEGWSGEYLKRRVKDCDKYFPSPKGSLESVKRWLWSWAWAYQVAQDDIIPCSS